MRSVDLNKAIGRLKPDLLIRAGDAVVALLDTKYKRLRDTPERPRAVEPSDLHQIATHSLRYRPSWGAALLCPLAEVSDGSGTSYADTALGRAKRPQSAFGNCP